jgi:hypothetical protein
MTLEKIVNKSILDWPSDALWAYRTSYKNPMDMSPYKMVYGKDYLPLELEHKDFWAIKLLNFDFKIAREKRILHINLLKEWTNKSYENAKLFKEKIKV